MSTSTLAVSFVGFALAAITITVAVRLRGTALAALRLAAGEEVIFESDNLVLRLTFKSEVHLRDAFVRVTSHRIFMGNGSLRDLQRARVQFVGLLDDFRFGNGVLSDGYATFPLKRARTTSSEATVRLVPLGAGFEVPSRIDILCDDRVTALTLRAALDGSKRAREECAAPPRPTALEADGRS